MLHTQANFVICNIDPYYCNLTMRILKTAGVWTGLWKK